MYKIILLISIPFIFALSSCSASKKNHKISESSKLEKTVSEYFNSRDSIQAILSPDKNLALYLQESNPSNIVPHVDIRFLVYSKLNDTILYKNSFSKAHIKWFNNDQLLLTRKMGFEDKKTGMSTKQYIIDVYKKELYERKRAPEYEK